MKNGEAATFSKVRTQKKALAKMARRVPSCDVENHGLLQCCRSLYRLVRSCVRVGTRCDRPLVGKTVMVLPASPVIGVHVGPAMGLAYECAAPIEGKFVTLPEIIAS